jgi:hypothetical protein
MIADHTLRRLMSQSRVALYGDLIRALLWTAAGVSWAFFWPFYLRPLAGLTSSSGNDFPIFYYTARLVADGMPMYGASPARYGIEWGPHLGNLNPPHFQLLLQPLAWVPYERALVAWSVLNAAALALSLAVIVRTLGIRLTFKKVFGLGALVVASAPFTSVAITAEWSFLLLAPFTLAWASARRGRWGAAGGWLGLCVALKLFFLLFLPWLLLQRRWGALAAAGTIVMLAFAGGAAVHGWATYGLWLESLRAVDWWWLPMNASGQGFVSRLVDGGGVIRPLVAAPALLQPMAAAGAAIVGVVSVTAAVRFAPRGAGVDGSFLVLLAGALLASPLGWVYYVPLAVGPAAGAIASGAWTGVPRGWRVTVLAASVGLYVPVEHASAGQPSLVATMTLASAYFWALLALWLAVTVTAWSSRTSLSGPLLRA